MKCVAYNDACWNLVLSKSDPEKEVSKVNCECDRSVSLKDALVNLVSEKNPETRASSKFVKLRSVLTKVARGSQPSISGGIWNDVADGQPQRTLSQRARRNVAQQKLGSFRRD